MWDSEAGDASFESKQHHALAVTLTDSYVEYEAVFNAAKAYLGFRLFKYCTPLPQGSSFIQGQDSIHNFAVSHRLWSGPK